MRPGKIVLIASGFIVLCLVYYCLFPKYEFRHNPGSDIYQIFRHNRITGKVEVFSKERVFQASVSEGTKKDTQAKAPDGENKPIDFSDLLPPKGTWTIRETQKVLIKGRLF